MTDEMLEVTFAGGRAAPARARSALQGLNGSLAGLRQDVRLLVSELVTNAVTHGGTGSDSTVKLVMSSSPRGVRVEVVDRGPGFERADNVDPLENGFGLALVDRLADRWGVWADDGTRVWFEIDREDF